MYNVLDISRYIINYCNKNNKTIDVLKLQKILYYTQKEFLKSKNCLCFQDDFTFSDYGPELDKVYREYRIYNNNIPYQKTFKYIKYNKKSSLIKQYTCEFDDSFLSFQDKHIINNIINKYIDFNIFDLVEKTLNELHLLKLKNKDIIPKKILNFI